MKSSTRIPILVALLISLMVSLPAWAGRYYQSTTVQQNDKGKETSRIVTNAWVDGDRAKIAFVEGPKGSPFADQTYMLTTDGGATLYLVDPKEKAYSRWDMEAMMAMAGSIMESLGPMLQIDFTNFEATKLSEAGGDRILGLDTKRVRWRTSFDINMKILGMKRENHTETTQELWLTDEIGDAGFGVWLRADNFRTGNEQLDKAIRESYAEIRGFFPLKGLSTTRMITKKGKETVTHASMQVDVLREEAIEPGTFELPADYEERPMLPTMSPPADGESGADAGEEEGGGPLKSLRRRFGRNKEKD